MVVLIIKSGGFDHILTYKSGGFGHIVLEFAYIGKENITTGVKKICVGVSPIITYQTILFL